MGSSSSTVVSSSFTLTCRSENMWIEHRVNVKSALKTGDNELHISFASPFIKVRLRCATSRRRSASGNRTSLYRVGLLTRYTGRTSFGTATAVVFIFARASTSELPSVTCSSRRLTLQQLGLGLGCVCERHMTVSCAQEAYRSGSCDRRPMEAHLLTHVYHSHY